MVVPQKTGRTVPNRGRIGRATVAKDANSTDWKLKGSLSLASVMMLGWQKDYGSLSTQSRRLGYARSEAFVVSVVGSAKGRSE